MEAKINIAEILKDKPQGTKLYSSACGKCTLEEADDKSFKISFYNSKFGFMNGGEGYLDKNGKLYDEGECVVFPSREMRDWEKFAWKKGDVLAGAFGASCIFDKWANDDYTRFDAKFVTPKSRGTTFEVEDWCKITNEAVIKQYISNIEEFKGDKLNLATLEIEKQTEFKDGDIVTAVFTNGNEMICVFKEKIEQDYMAYCGFFSKGKREGDVFMDLGYDCIYNDDPICKEIRFATEEEKQQLFEALAKEGKAWDAEKKAIVDLKTKVELKPFDKVLVRDRNTQRWDADLFGFKSDGVNIFYHCVGGSWNFCIPYIGNESLLGTTKDAED